MEISIWGVIGPPKAGQNFVFWAVRWVPGIARKTSGTPETPKFRACGARAATRKSQFGSPSDLYSVLARRTGTATVRHAVRYRYGLEKFLALTRGGKPLVARVLHSAVQLVSSAATTRPLPEPAGILKWFSGFFTK